MYTVATEQLLRKSKHTKSSKTAQRCPRVFFFSFHSVILRSERFDSFCLARANQIIKAATISLGAFYRTVGILTVCRVPRPSLCFDISHRSTIGTGSVSRRTYYSTVSCYFASAEREEESVLISLLESLYRYIHHIPSETCEVQTRRKEKSALYLLYTYLVAYTDRLSTARRS
jgi:hypothetical protein